MSHAASDKRKLLDRIRQIRGQVDGITRVIEDDRESAIALHQATNCRDEIDRFIAEVIEAYISEHMLDPEAPRDDSFTRAAEELVAIVHAYLT